MLRNRRPQRVYVLGAGPAGLLAAHAATSKGYEVTVFSKPDASGNVAKSELFGCQYLHSFISGLGMQKKGEVVRYLLDGPAEGYRQKVYGAAFHGSTSVDEYGPEEDHQAWDIRETYDTLWEAYGKTAMPVEMTPALAGPLYTDAYAFVVSALPAPVLCRDMENHKFSSQRVWAMGTTGINNAQLRAMPYTAPNMTVQCNGWRDKAWYRAATVFGYSTLEWPEGRKPPIAGVAAVSKPLSTDCTCWQGKRSMRVGRFGTWTKGVLVHTAYSDTMKALP
jgi:threonine dehydrogenase-like Zn-dependent dehydrogenase